MHDIKAVVIGLGETGKPLYDILNNAVNTIGYDSKEGTNSLVAIEKCEVLHICIPYSDRFLDIVQRYREMCHPDVTVVHSTVPIGTTEKITNAVHSPILGRHDDMGASLLAFEKWIGGDIELVKQAGDQLYGCGIHLKHVKDSKITEAMKLMCLAKYGVSIAFSRYQKRVCDALGINYDLILEWDQNYNEHVAEHLRRPLIECNEEHIGGHCVIQNTRILSRQFPNPILQEILKYAPEQQTKEYTFYPPSNIYESAKIGNNVNIGAFTEIGHKVQVGDNVRIGAMCFIPEGVTIHENAWIGPRVTFTNDKFPPSGRENWKETIVERGVKIGAGCTILPGITIGENALIGAGSVVTKSIPAGETWCGVPAENMNKSLDELIQNSAADNLNQ